MCRRQYGGKGEETVREPARRALGNKNLMTKQWDRVASTMYIEPSVDQYDSCKWTNWPINCVMTLRLPGCAA